MNCEIWRVNLASVFVVAVELDALLQSSQAIWKIFQLRLLDLRNVPVLLNARIDLADIVDCLLRVVLQRCFHIHQGLVGRIQLFLQKLKYGEQSVKNTYNEEAE